ncbi:hypothetical protein [Actinoalloteichus caeruleus]|uniref:hypothetical protein n=1 Tax=Actinoalloteichus cyanogriseus TaxID=2893586 RepID=UPI0020A4D928|nr:hypothetical protein [Actinoalloteichus caeruleus]
MSSSVERPVEVVAHHASPGCARSSARRGAVVAPPAVSCAVVAGSADRVAPFGASPESGPTTG